MQHKPLMRLGGLILAAATALALISCNGSSGATGATGAAGANGTNGSNGSNGSNGAPGTPGAPGAPAAISVTTMDQATWTGLSLTGTVTSVNMTSGQPVVNFSVATTSGTPVAGFSKVTSQAAGNLPVSYPNLAFGLVKLVPTATVNPAVNNTMWVSYLIDSTPSASQLTPIPGHPTTDNTGTLTEDGNGNYTYTFARNIQNEAAWLAAQVTAGYFTGNNLAADLGDVSYQPTLTHRLGIRIGGPFPGTSTNTPNGVSTGAPAAYPAKTANVTYDFVPAGGPVTTGRTIVNVAACNACHTVLGGSGTLATGTTAGTQQGLAFHSGEMNDPNFCVFCHNEQLKYGSADSLPAALATMTLNGNGLKVNGFSTGTIEQWIHKFHLGANLGYAGYPQNMNAGWYPQDIRKCTTCHQQVTNAAGTTLNPQFANFQTNPTREACGACHDLVNFATGNIAPGGTNPVNGLANVHNGGMQADDTLCGVCHTAADITVYHTSLQSPIENGSTPYAGSHAATQSTSWQAPDPSNMPAGAITVSYNIKAVTVNATHNPVINFQILVNGSAATIAAAPVGAAANSAEMIPNLANGPELGIQMGLSQDGIAAPMDYNLAIEQSWPIKQIWNGNAFVNGGSTLVSSTGIVASATPGYYQITLDGIQVPAGTKLMGMGIGWSPFIQTSMGTPVVALANLDGEGTPNFAWTAASSPTGVGTGGLWLPATTVWATCSSSGFTARRTIIAENACNSCHGDLGIFTANQFQQTTFAGFNNETAVPIVPALSSGLYPNGLAINGYANQFHNAYMNDPQSCIFCHTTSGQTDGWNYNIKNWVHGIHSSGFRNNPYTAHNTSQFWRIKYPAILNNCEACHVPGSYDFSNSTNANQIPSMLWDTEASGTVSAALQAAPAPGPAQYTLPQVTAPAKAYAAPFVTPGSTYGTSFGGAWALPLTASQTYTNTPAAAGTLVTSPLTAACSGCHDSPTAIYHMAGGIGGTVGGGVGGGVFYGPRPAVGTVPANTESCLVCHGQGTIADIYTVHLNFAGANPVN